jgi:hypothetical protein
MTTREQPQIRNVLVTKAKNGQMWGCQPIELGIDDRMWRLQKAAVQAIRDGMS